MQLTAYFDSAAIGAGEVERRALSPFLVMVRRTSAVSPLTSRYCRDCHSPSGNSRSRARSSALGLLDQRAAGLVDGLGAVFVDQRLHPLARDVVAGDHRAEVERDHLRRAHHVEHRVEDVLHALARGRRCLMPGRRETLR